MKKLTKKQLQELSTAILNKGFLNWEEVHMFREKFNYSYETFKRELMNNKIPFKSGNAANVLLSFGVKIKEKKIRFGDFYSLGNWKLEVFKNSKIRVIFECQECGKESDARLAKVINREFFPNEPICSTCINKLVRNTDECKKRNSKAQFIAQNRPEVKKKNKESQLKRFENPEVRKKHSEAGKKNWQNADYRRKMKEIAKKKWDDPEYAKRVIQNSKNGGLKGIYKNIYYDSGYELAWLMLMELREGLDGIHRANIYISYINYKEKFSHYYPDFILNEKYLIEVKGYGPWANRENISKKNKAAKLWCQMNNMRYRLVEFKDIGNHWYRKAREKHKELDNDTIKK